MKYLLAAIPMMAFLGGSVSLGAAATATAPAGLSLEKIMADPDWIGPPVQNAYWSADGRSVYYSLKRIGSPIVDLHRIDASSGKDQAVDAAAMAGTDGPAVFDRAGKHAAFVRHHDIFVRELGTRRLTQITRTPEMESSPQFSADGKLLTFRIGNDWFVHDLAGGVTTPAAIVKAEKDPDAPPAADDLREMQMRSFSTLRKLHDDKETARQHDEAMQKGDASRAVLPFYLGDDVVIRGTELSPDARWLLVVTEPKSHVKGREGQLTRYVTESGYEEFEKERLRAGRNPPAPQSLLLLNLADHSLHPLPLEKLPGIHDDPLKAVRDENAKAQPAGKPQAGAEHDERKARGVWVINREPDAINAGIVWSADGGELGIALYAIDHKDRWIVSVDLANYVLVPQHRLSDAAWIDRSFNEFGWLNDNRTLWYESEESGFAHLYTKTQNGEPHALTHGQFEVSEPQLSQDGRWFYVLSNEVAPYSYDVYRVPSGGGPLERLTRLEGVEQAELDRSGKQLLLMHSTPYMRTQIAVTKADGSGGPRELTDTRTAEYKSMTWIQPEIVKIPSTHFDGVVYAKLYRDKNIAAANKPAVLFIHGAGYLQDVHLRYSYYFREQMFNNLLAHQGYVVLDMDYRASAGYGRDWRTAIYRQMGHPELEDLLDGKKWLVEQAAVDPKHVGVYGGSYGGFMTLMALFRAPGEFAAGAALRPVTDWMQYNNGYTTGILNDPQVDPIAYARSSPIEFASGLKDALLICHGVIDDNVLFEDSMRLYEHLIELHKDNFTLSPYPLDRHGFSNADSWLDEYKRIYRLFEANLR
ncbi:MAG TPA: prolyl oligopeptidase family serine peptidase [Steroidobacteraceae bacterium]|jgi:dipeptidyl aminopeptidase/acylaminoacyl peptidase|nr:prolyl oligopeptidase family serine peptidase [Steroidobacteraceae bacterium]